MNCPGRLIAATLLAVFGSRLAMPQATAVVQISGTVVDPNGGVVPRAHVKVTQTATGLIREATTGEDGNYVLSSLPIGPYRLNVEAGGFKAYVQDGIVLQVSNNPVVNVKMELGSITQQVEVNANASMVEAQTTGVSQVIDQRRVVDLPLNGRQPTQLVLLSGCGRNCVTQRFGEQQELCVIDYYIGGWRAGKWHLLSPGRWRPQ